VSRILQSGVVSAVKAVIYVATAVRINSLVLANISEEDDRWCKIWVNDRFVLRVNLEYDGGHSEIIYPVKNLGLGDYISAQAEDGTSVEFTINGVPE
jgi:hypothetical protein